MVQKVFSIPIRVKSVIVVSTNTQYDHRPPDRKLDDGKSSDDVLGSRPQRENSGKQGGNSPNLEGFNETEYILAVKRDADSYKHNAFNQEASDKLRSDRSLPDTRHYRSVLLTGIILYIPF